MEKQRQQETSNNLNLRKKSVAKIVKNLKKSGSFTEDKSTFQTSTNDYLFAQSFLRLILL